MIMPGDIRSLREEDHKGEPTPGLKKKAARAKFSRGGNRKSFTTGARFYDVNEITFLEGEKRSGTKGRKPARG